ncbi:MAG TPA: phosphotransferase family protein [Caulobacteraceae bacterium]|nr:phosphotransferase family protein [Caulobacteraceae bacterium]
MSEPDDFAGALSAVAARHIAGADHIENLRRLSGGASQETWAFEAVGPHLTKPLILRRAPGGERVHESAVGPENEARLMQLAVEAGAPAPIVQYVLTPEDGLGRGFIVGFIEGETLGRKIVRDDRFAAIRPGLARRCGEVLAMIHAIDPARLPPLRTATALGRFNELHTRYKTDGRPRPVFALAFEWLRDHLPPDPPRPRLVHADFRNGNLIIGEDGLRAVLDWEIAHLGDPIEDLGWICVGPWRFGGIDKPVGGFGTREEMIAGYEAAGGGKVDPEHLRFWEVLGSLSWGVSCSAMVLSFRGGIDPSSERAMIARRASENEIDLLNLLAPRAAA